MTFFLATGNLDMKSGVYQSRGASLTTGMLSPWLLGTWSKAHWKCKMEFPSFSGWSQLSLLLPSINPMDCSLPGSSVHGIPQAIILERVAVPFSGESSQPRDLTQVSCIAGRFFTIWATTEACQKSYQLSKASWNLTFSRNLPQFLLTWHPHPVDSNLLCCIGLFVKEGKRNYYF